MKLFGNGSHRGLLFETWSEYDFPCYDIVGSIAWLRTAVDFGTLDILDSDLVFDCAKNNCTII